MSGKSKKSNKAMLDAGPSAGEDSNPQQHQRNSKPVRQGKPSRHLEGSADALPQDQFNGIIAKNGEIAYSHCFDIEDGKFAVGWDATAATKELRGTDARVPNDLYVCRALSQYLQKKGIRDVSSSTIYDWMRAAETREALGGKDKAPKISISFYVALSRDEIPMEKRREYLLYAIDKQLTVKELKDHIGRDNGSIGSAEGAPTNGDAISDIATLERTLSESQSILSGKYNEFLAIKPEENSQTLDRLENFAIYVWQIRDAIANGGAKKDDE